MALYYLTKTPANGTKFPHLRFNNIAERHYAKAAPGS